VLSPSPARRRCRCTRAANHPGGSGAAPASTARAGCRRCSRTEEIARGVEDVHPRGGQGRARRLDDRPSRRSSRARSAALHEEGGQTLPRVPSSKKHLESLKRSTLARADRGGFEQAQPSLAARPRSASGFRVVPAGGRHHALGPASSSPTPLPEMQGGDRSLSGARSIPQLQVRRWTPTGRQRLTAVLEAEGLERAGGHHDRERLLRERPPLHLRNRALSAALELYAVFTRHGTALGDPLHRHDPAWPADRIEVDHVACLRQVLLRVTPTSPGEIGRKDPRVDAGRPPAASPADAAGRRSSATSACSAQARGGLDRGATCSRPRGKRVEERLTPTAPRYPRTRCSVRRANG